MSFQAMAAVARYTAKNSTEKLLLFLIANYADEDGVAFPSQERLAQDGSMDVRTVQRTLASLEQSLAITRERRQRPNGSRTSDQITLVLGRPDRVSGRLGIQGDKMSGDAPARRRGGPGDVSPPEPVTDPVEPDTPLPPKGGSGRKDPSPEAMALMERLWTVSSASARRRSGRMDVARAADAALARGGAPDDMVVAVAAHCTGQRQLAEDGRYAKGTHTLLHQDRWRDWLPDSPAERARMLALETKLSAEPDSAPTVEETKTSPEAVAFAEVGTIDAPGPRRQRSWMDDWQRNPFAWRREWGPAPGEEGCRIDPDIQREFGAEPWSGEPDGAAA